MHNGHFQFVWASPTCIQDSKAKTIGERDLEGADKLVSMRFEIIAHFGCHSTFEKPNPGLLKTRDIEGHREGPAICRHHVLQIWFAYRKATKIWTSFVLSIHEACSLRNPCSAMIGRQNQKDRPTTEAGLGQERRKQCMITTRVV